MARSYLPARSVSLGRLRLDFGGPDILSVYWRSAHHVRSTHIGWDRVPEAVFLTYTDVRQASIGPLHFCTRTRPRMVEW